MELICLNIISQFNREAWGWGKDLGKQNTGTAQRTREEPALKNLPTQRPKPTPPAASPKTPRGGGQSGHKP